MAVAALSVTATLNVAAAAPKKMPVSMRRLTPVLFYLLLSCSSALAKIGSSRGYARPRSLSLCSARLPVALLGRAALHWLNRSAIAGMA